ncbi:MAG: DUF1801 domain-containing protein [Chloroflexota bacterium]
MPAKTDFASVFQELKKILQPFAPKLTVKTDSADVYYLDGPYSPKWKKELYFGSVHIQKNYVSFYFMPVYMYPDLLNGISPELKKHMQGKSCFNFKQVEPALFKELKALVRKGYDRFKKDAYAE